MRVQFRPGYWLNQVTCDVLSSRVLLKRIDDGSVTGLAFSTSHYHHAIRSTAVYDTRIMISLRENTVGEELLLRLAINDIRCAADLLRNLYDKSGGLEGWASIDASPLTVHDAAACAAAAKSIYDRAFRPNVFIRIPGTPEALPAIEEATFLGVPVHVTLLFTCEQYLAAAFAYIRGLERRIAAGSSVDVRSALSVTTKPWDAAVADSGPAELCSRAGTAMGRRISLARRKLLGSRRWKHVSDLGARPQTLCWDSPQAGGRKIVPQAMAVQCLSEIHLRTPGQSGAAAGRERSPGIDACDLALERFERAGVDFELLGDRLQADAFAAEVRAWIDLLTVIANKSAALATPQPAGRPQKR